MNQKKIIKKLEINIFPIENEGVYQSNYKKYNIDEIIELCIVNKWKRIGFTPAGSNYIEMIETISKNHNIYLEEIFFFHLNKDDFKSLYGMC